MPSAIFSPAFITTTRSHSARIASMTCSIMTMVMPSRRIWRISSMPICSSVGLRPASHSSSSSSRGRVASARASSSALLVDVGQLRRRADARVRRARRARAARRASRAGDRRIDRIAAEHAAEHDVLARRHVRQHAHELERAGDARRGRSGTTASRRCPRPRSRIDAAVGRAARR